MKIFLARFKTITTPYLQSRRESEWLYRLVQARDEDDALKKLRQAVSVPDSEGNPTSLWHAEFSEMIQ